MHWPLSDGSPAAAGVAESQRSVDYSYVLGVRPAPERHDPQLQQQPAKPAADLKKISDLIRESSSANRLLTTE